MVLVNSTTARHVAIEILAISNHCKIIILILLKIIMHSIASQISKISVSLSLQVIAFCRIKRTKSDKRLSDELNTNTTIGYSNI